MLIVVAQSFNRNGDEAMGTEDTGLSLEVDEGLGTGRVPLKAPALTTPDTPADCDHVLLTTDAQDL